MGASDSKRRDDGRAMSLVVRADVKFYGSSPFLGVDVRFAGEEQLDDLIAALTKLREFPTDGFDHVHLQDMALVPTTTQTALAEITFWHPSVQRSAVDEDCVSDAQRMFEGL